MADHIDDCIAERAADHIEEMRSYILIGFNQTVILVKEVKLAHSKSDLCRK